MKYYRVKPMFDNRNVWDRAGKYRGVLIGGELYTARELKILKYPESVYRCLETVEIPKNRVYWFFGCRFEMGV